jgi:hypothetical protein
MLTQTSMRTWWKFLTIKEKSVSWITLLQTSHFLTFGRADDFLSSTSSSSSVWLLTSAKRRKSMFLADCRLGGRFGPSWNDISTRKWQKTVFTFQTYEKFQFVLICTKVFCVFLLTLHWKQCDIKFHKNKNSTLPQFPT